MKENNSIFEGGLMRIISVINCSILSSAINYNAAIAQEVLLPSEKSLTAFEKLAIEQEPQINVHEIKVLNVNKSALPVQSMEKFNFNESGNISVPLIVPDTMILQLKPDITAKEIQALKSDRNLTVVNKFSNTGQIQVKTDLSKYFKPKLTDSSANETLLRGINDAVIDFKSDPRIIGATPDTFLQSQSVTNLNVPTETFLSDPTSSTGEKIDWGINDIEADKVWSMPGAQNGIIFGIVDAGFAQHEDIVFSGISEGISVSNHGNHVAGIACATHDNNLGIKGVIPHCFVRPRVGSYYEITPGGGNVLQFYVRFS
jgi:hypothetical protein